MGTVQVVGRCARKGREQEKRFFVFVLNLHEKIVMIGSRVTVKEFLESFVICARCCSIRARVKDSWKMTYGIFFRGPGRVSSESESRIGEGRRKSRRVTWNEGGQGLHKGHFHIPAGMVVRGWTR